MALDRMIHGAASAGQAAFGDHWRRVRDELDHAVDREIPRFFEDLPAADRAVLHSVLKGGKRLRGVLVVLVNEALGGVPEAGVPRAIAIECVQAASLIHDDLVDGDILRRDRPATWTVLGARRAVLLGDLIFATALRRTAELGREDGVVLARAIATMAAGAYQEPLASPDLALDPGPDAARLYPRLIHLKTGVLFGAAAHLGALAAGVPAPMATRAFEYGARIGEAYQIVDDLQDLLEMPDAAKCQLLAPAVWHFGADLQGAEPCRAPTLEEVERMGPALRARMMAAVEHRLQRSIAAVDSFPSGPSTEVLRAAPHAIVRAMSAGAQ